jgi:hypothetical protein
MSRNGSDPAPGGCVNIAGPRFLGGNDEFRDQRIAECLNRAETKPMAAGVNAVKLAVPRRQGPARRPASGAFSRLLAPDCRPRRRDSWASSSTDMSAATAHSNSYR